MYPSQEHLYCKERIKNNPAQYRFWNLRLKRTTVPYSVALVA